MRVKSESTLNVIWNLLVRIVLAALLVYLTWRVRSVLITIVLAAMLAYLLIPAVEVLCRPRVLSSRRTQRLIATTLVFIGFLSISFIVVKLLITPFGQEAQHFLVQLNDYASQSDERLEAITKWYKANVPEDMQKFLGKQDFRSVGTSIAKFGSRVIEGTTSWVRSVLELVMIPVLAFYFVLDSRSLKKEFVALLPTRHMRDAVRISNEISQILQSYVLGQLVLCLIAGVLTWIVLSLTGIKYALVLAVLAGVTRAIPVIGPVISGIPICILAALQSMNLGILMLIFVTVMHFAESKFIMPILIGDRMKLHPAVILIVLLIGAELFGLLGMFLAAPIAAIIREMINLYVVRPRNGKSNELKLEQEAEPGLARTEQA